MVLATKVPKPEKVRLLKQGESHIVTLEVKRLDGTANLASAVVDLTEGKVTVRQETQPITFKTAEDFDDLIGFYQQARDLLANRPKPVLDTE